MRIMRGNLPRSLPDGGRRIGGSLCGNGAGSAEETALEEEEARQPFPKERRLAEEKRWPVQEKRHQIETEKWQVEQKMMTVEEKVAENTNAYQKFLDEEEELKTKKATLERDIAPKVEPKSEDL